MSAKTTGTVKFTLDPKNPPGLTPRQRARLQSLTDEEINLTDIPPASGVKWKRPGKTGPRLDEDVLSR